MEFTGNYNKCTQCCYIYDYEDSCPECGSDEIDDINANEVLQTARVMSGSEKRRLVDMLESHDDLKH